MHVSPESPESERAPDPSAPSAWTRAHAERLRRREGLVAPVFYPPDAEVAPGHHVWDTWFLRTRGGAIASVDGWRVALALTADEDLLPGKRHDVATIRYLYSRDGSTWEVGGPVFSGGALGSRQWAGSALYDDGDVYVFYTAAGDAGEVELSYGQRLAVASGGSLEADDDGVTIAGPWEHAVALAPDGDHYETEAQARGMISTFRDPWFYEDDGETYLLFEANTPVPEGADACGGDPAQQEFNGVVGVARSPSGDPTEWTLEPPLLEAVCVNQELERPHVVTHDGRYYLFFSSHVHTFAPGLNGFDGLYGFVADSFRGEYRPLNGSGLVVANPANAPYQAYSWLAFVHDDELLATSFLNYYDYDRPSLDDVAELPEAEQKRRFGGTFAPTLRLSLDGDETRITGKLGHGTIPVPGEELPDPVFGDSLPARAFERGDPAGLPDEDRMPADYVGYGAYGRADDGE